jgi:ATP-dependent HslUV protease ATP-binding subunit HslU
MEKLLEDLAFNIPDMDDTEVVIDEEYVKSRFLDSILADDMDRYIL